MTGWRGLCLRYRCDFCVCKLARGRNHSSFLAVLQHGTQPTLLACLSLLLLASSRGNVCGQSHSERYACDTRATPLLAGIGPSAPTTTTRTHSRGFCPAPLPREIGWGGSCERDCSVMSICLYMCVRGIVLLVGSGSTV
jgi:hypothetical protein